MDLYLALEELSPKDSFLFALDCTKHVIPIFKKRCPKDKKIAKFIELLDKAAEGIVLEYYEKLIQAHDEAIKIALEYQEKYKGKYCEENLCLSIIYNTYVFLFHYILDK